jgi:hypothetical protein
MLLAYESKPSYGKTCSHTPFSGPWVSAAGAERGPCLRPVGCRQCPACGGCGGWKNLEKIIYSQLNVHFMGVTFKIGYYFYNNEDFLIL